MLGEVGDGVIIYTYISYIHIISYYMQRSQHVNDERLRRVGFDFDQILAKLYRKTGYGEPLVPFTDEDKCSCSEARVHVMINPHHRFHHRYLATSPCYDKSTSRDIPRPFCIHGHILSPINVEEFSKQGLIYSRVTGQNDTDHQVRPIQPGTTEYWYLVQDEDHLSSYDPGPALRGDLLQDLVRKLYGGEENTRFDDVARGHIKLVTNDELRSQYELVTPCAGAGAVAVAGKAQSLADAMADTDEPSLLLMSSSKRPFGSKGGNKSKKRKNKRKTRNKRRRNKTRKN